MNFQELLSRIAEIDKPVQEEKADKDYDGDGEIESGKDEVWGSRLKAAKEKDVDEAFIDECGMDMPNGMMGMRSEPPKQSDSVTMNVSMNGSGAGGIKDLMNILKNIEDAGEGHSDISGDGDNMEMPIVMKAMGDQDHDDEMDMDMEADMEMDEFANEPDEMYGDVGDVTGTGGDLHSKGGEAPKVNGGGNPILKVKVESIIEHLNSLYTDIKHR